MGDWWGFIATVKQKSEELFEQTKKDLGEFVAVVQHDTQEVVSSAAVAVQRDLGLGDDASGVETLARQQQERSYHVLGSLSSADDHDAVPLDRSEAALRAMRLHPTTYEVEPADAAAFSSWQSTFDLSSKTDEISRMLAGSAEVRAHHSRLVPSSVLTYALFWGRYYYRVHVFVEEEKRRLALVSRVHSSQDDIAWDDEADEADTTSAGKDTVSEDIKEDATPAVSHAAPTALPTEQTAAHITTAVGDSSTLSPPAIRTHTPPHSYTHALSPQTSSPVPERTHTPVLGEGVGNDPIPHTSSSGHATSAETTPAVSLSALSLADPTEAPTAAPVSPRAVPAPADFSHSVSAERENATEIDVAISPFDSTVFANAGEPAASAKPAAEDISAVRAQVFCVGRSQFSGLERIARPGSFDAYQSDVRVQPKYRV
eukprot:Opistho-2@49635